MAVISISRQFGSGGDEIAHLLCETLGYKFFDKYTVLEAYREMVVSREVVSAKETPIPIQDVIDYSEDNYKAHGVVEHVLGGVPIIPYTGGRRADVEHIHEVDEPALLEDDSLQSMQKAIRWAYQAGNMVIVGRGGHAILNNLPHALHLRIIAPLADRVERVKTYLKRNEHTFFDDLECRLDARALELIRQHDAASADYIRRFYHVDWDDPTLYHAIINTGKMTSKQAVNTITALVHECQ